MTTINGLVCKAEVLNKIDNHSHSNGCSEFDSKSDSDWYVQTKMPIISVYLQGGGSATDSVLTTPVQETGNSDVSDSSKLASNANANANVNAKPDLCRVCGKEIIPNVWVTFYYHQQPHNPVHLHLSRGENAALSVVRRYLGPCSHDQDQGPEQDRDICTEITTGTEISSGSRGLYSLELDLLKRSSIETVQIWEKELREMYTLSVMPGNLVSVEQLRDDISLVC